MKLIILGNCLSSLRGWTDMVAKELNYELVNLALAGSGNDLQLNLMKEYLTDNKINPNDIIIWQIASPDTLTLRVGPEYYEEAKVLNDHMPRHMNHFVAKSKNKFDNLYRIDLLFHSPMRKLGRNPLLEDSKQQYQELLFMFTILKALGARILVTKGKYEDVSPEDWETFKRLLDERDIPYMDETVINWCEKEGLCFFKMNPIPTRRSRMEFGRRVLIPKLKDLGWM